MSSAIGYDGRMGHLETKQRAVAALPWYNFAATRPVLDAVWREVARQLQADGITHVPECLDHSTPHNLLLSNANLVLSQCCGPELFLPRAEHVVPVAAPVITTYAVTPGHYVSYIVVRRDVELTHPRVAVNDLSSYSGHIAARRWLESQGLEYSIRVSGSHAQSVLDIQSGRADLAAVDALSWRFLNTEGLYILDRSQPVLAPPFVTGRASGVSVDRLTDALDTAFAQFGEAIGISGAIAVTRSDYLTLCE